jgi:hypothetical protein
MATEAYPLGYVAGRHTTENAAGGAFQQPQRLIAGGFEMTWGPTLPRNRGLFGLLDQASETDFRGSNELRITGLQESG